MILDYFKLAFRSMLHRKIRTGLTVIGIIIGIAAIVSLITISQGLENAVTQQFENFGANRIYVSAKGIGFSASSLRSGLTTDDTRLLNGMAEFKWVNEYLVDSVTVEFDKEKIPATVTAIDITDLKQKWQDINIGVSDGRLFSGKEKFSAVIGINIAKEAFKKKARINNKLLIGGKEFTIIGILNEVGNPDDDSSIMLPIDTFRDIFNKPTDVSMIELVVKDGVDMQRAADKVKRKLERAHDENDFEVLTPEQLLNQLGNVLLVVQVVLVGIAAISLVVGALGIMNTMYTSVTERTNEIGIMKSIGAKNVDILLLFLVESGIIGLVGGLLGIACGVFISSMVSLIAKQAGFGLLLIKINMPLMAFSLGFAFFMGTISGLVPAVRASRLRPAEALGR